MIYHLSVRHEKSLPGGGLFSYHRKERPMIRKRMRSYARGTKAALAIEIKTAMIALRRNGMMSLERPAVGGESCRQDSFL